jgi:hypothetical protein
MSAEVIQPGLAAAINAPARIGLDGGARGNAGNAQCAIQRVIKPQQCIGQQAWGGQVDGKRTATSAAG